MISPTPTGFTSAGAPPPASAGVSANLMQSVPGDWGLFGDSRAFLGHYVSGNNELYKGNGLAGAIQALSGGAITIPYALMGGVAGDTTAQCYARQAAYITKLQAAGAKGVFMICGTNDRTGNKLRVDETQTYIFKMVEAFRKAGIPVVLMNDTPRGTGSSSYELTLDQAADHYRVRQWIDGYMSQFCAVANTWDTWIDRTTGARYWPLAAMVQDGIHPSKVGAFTAAVPAVAQALLLSRALPRILQGNMLYNATNSPWGSLTANPIMSGVNGTIAASANPVAGSVLAAGWNAEGEAMTGLTTRWSKEIIKGIEWQKVVVQGVAATNANFNLYVDINQSQLADNDNVYASGLFKCQGEGLSMVGLQILAVNNAWTLKIAGDDNDATQPFPTKLGECGRVTPVLAYTTAAAYTLVRPRFLVNLTPGAKVNATLWFRNMGAFKG